MVDASRQDWAVLASEDYPYLAELSLPDRLRLAAYVAGDHGVAAVHIRAILDAAEGLESVQTRSGLTDKGLTSSPLLYLKTSVPSRVP